MPKFDKPDSPNIIWGVNALDEDLTRPDDSYIQTGWTQVKPPYEYENYSMNKLYQGFAYYNQLGFPEWDSVTEYQANKSYVQGSNDRIYKCIQTHLNRNPATSGNEAWWELFEGNRQATTASRGTIELATTAETDTGSSNTLAVTPQGILQGILGTGKLQQSKGHVKIPVNISGSKVEFIVQWGIVNGSASTTYDIVFPNEVLNIQITDRFSSDAYGLASPGGITQTGFAVTTDDPNLSYWWLAIGY